MVVILFDFDSMSGSFPCFCTTVLFVVDTFTDTGISKFNGEMQDKEMRDLTPWEADGGMDINLDEDTKSSVSIKPLILVFVSIVNERKDGQFNQLK